MQVYQQVDKRYQVVSSTGSILQKRMTTSKNWIARKAANTLLNVLAISIQKVWWEFKVYQLDRNEGIFRANNNIFWLDIVMK